MEKAIGEVAPVIVLRDVQGWSAEQVCAALAIGDAEHRRLLHHARSAVRRALELFHDGARPHPGGILLSALTCQDVVELATDLLEQQLGALEAEVTSHVDGCAGCRAYIEQMRQTIRALASLKREPLTTEEFTTLLNAFRAPPPA